MGNVLYIAIDQGSHATRALAYNDSGDVIAQSRYPVDTHRPSSGMVEVDPEQMVASVTDVIKEVIGKVSNVDSGKISVGLATQRSTIACWNHKTGDALCPLISWQDTRASEWLAQFSEHESEIHERTGLFMSAHYGVSKLRWCLDNVPAVKQAMVGGRLAVGPLSSFLTFRIMDDHPLYVDPANAARTLLWNYRHSSWDENLLALFGIPREILPKGAMSRYEFGKLIPECGHFPLEIVTGDQSAAIFAQGKPDKNTAIINIGSGAFVLRVTDQTDHISDRMLGGVVYEDADTKIQVIEGTVNGAGNALDWFKREFDCVDLESHLEQWLEEVDNPPLFVNGVSGVGSPYWLSNLESRFYGEADLVAMAVGLIESIVFLIQSNLDEMNAVMAVPETIRISGGLTQQDALCQKIADLSRIRVFRSEESESTARGLACLLAGFPASWSENIKGEWFEPNNNQNLHSRYREWSELMDGINT